MAIIDIFSKAIELSDPDERLAFVERACGDDASTRHQVMQMLEQYYDPKTFMKEPAIEAMQGASADGNETQLIPSEKPGDSIGPYKLLERIGEGGMGIIYMAEQRDQLVRRVALKIIKHGMDTKQVVARFEAERQALAMMEHPHIAKVLDAGATESGRPFFVMELVRGIPITEYCDTHRFTTEQRLQLFLSVCQAIQHAHQKGIIHRDIKPSNILVTLSDEKAHPVVIDFGIAKATHQRLTEKTLFTNFGLAIGTPAYMSPEQAQMSKLDVDTRSDVYSLGVLLYELLTGTTPIEQKELMSQGYGEMQRMIAEHEPPKPSLRISTLGIEDKKTTAQCRRVNDASLGHRIQGDLDWIVMKSLEKDRSRRYETVSGFASDIRRHLNDEPVSAAAPTFGYQLRKLYQRHRRQMKWIGSAATLILGFAIVSTTLAILLERQNRRADDRLFQSLVSQADATQKAGGVGYHTNVIETIKQAIDLRGEELNESDKRSLREIAMSTIGDPWTRSRTSRQYPKPDYESVTREFHVRDQIALGDEEGLVRIHDLFSGELSGTLKDGHEAAIYSIAPTRSRDVWATADRDGKILTWEREPGTAGWRVMDQITEPILGLPPMVQSCGEGFLVYAEESNQARLWYPGSGKVPEAIELPVNITKIGRDWKQPNNYISLAIASNGRWLAIPNLDDGTVVVFDIESGKVLKTIRDNAPQRWVCVFFGPDDDELCLGWSQKISVYETTTWSRLASKISNTQGTGWNLSIAENRPWIVFGRIRKTVWNYKSNAIVNTIEDFPWEAHFKPNDTDIYTLGSPFKQPDYWEVQELNGQEDPSTISIHLPIESLYSTAFSPDGRWLAASSSQGAWMTDLQTRKHTPLALPNHIIGTARPFFNHDGSLLACSTGRRSSEIIVWDTQSWKMIETEGITEPNVQIAFHPKDDLLAVESEPGGLSLYRYGMVGEGANQLLEFNEIGNVALKGRIHRIIFSDDGDYIGWANQAGGDVMHSDLSVAKINDDGLEPVFQLEDVLTWGFDFLPDSNELIASRFHSQDSSEPGNWVPEQWNFRSNTNQPIHQYNAKASSLDASPKNRWFATKSSSAGIALFDWNSKKSLGRMARFKSIPRSIQWAPDGTRLAILFDEGEIQIWDIEKMRHRLEELGLNW